MHGVEPYLAAIRAVSRVQVAPPITAPVCRRHVERPHRHRHAIRQTHRHLPPVERMVAGGGNHSSADKVERRERRQRYGG